MTSLQSVLGQRPEDAESCPLRIAQHSRSPKLGDIHRSDEHLASKLLRPARSKIDVIDADVRNPVGFWAA